MISSLRLIQLGRLHALPQSCYLYRQKTTRPEDVEDGVALSNDQRTIVCWHPEKSFPYECSLPLPEAPFIENNSPLKVQATAALKHIYRPKTPELERQELMNITYTTKHVWFPCSRRLKRKKTEMDRTYL